jgi:hypothetical protein
MVKIDGEAAKQTSFWAAISTVTTPTSQLTKDSITIIGATRNTKKYRFCEAQKCIVGGHQLRH